MARTLRSDQMLFWAALALVCTSVVMVVSASVVGGKVPLPRCRSASSDTPPSG